jgi:hypothetical protein
LVTCDVKNVPDKLPVLLVIFDDQYQFPSHLILLPSRFGFWIAGNLSHDPIHLSRQETSETNPKN